MAAPFFPEPDTVLYRWIPVASDFDPETIERHGFTEVKRVYDCPDEFVITANPLAKTQATGAVIWCRIDGGIDDIPDRWIYNYNGPALRLLIGHLLGWVP